MNRNQEYFELIEELEDNIPDIQRSVSKAINRRRRFSFLYVPTISLVATFAIFVLLVNFYAPVAYACSKVPILKELAEAVTFSRSLTDAVKNKYVQAMDLSQSKNDVTVDIDYLIVDQKQVNIFYRMDSNKCETLDSDIEILQTNGEQLESITFSNYTYEKEKGELCTITVDFIGQNVPDKLLVNMKVYERKSNTEVEESVTIENEWDIPEHSPAYLADFDFILEFDPSFTATGKIFPLNQVVEMDGQKIKIKEVQVYPSHLSVEIEDFPENTAWLRRLDFYIEGDLGTRFDIVSDGLTASSLDDTPAMTSFRADSPYFYKLNKLKLVITGAQWLRKDMEKVKLDLKTGKIDQVPQGTALDFAKKIDDTWNVAFRAKFVEGKGFYQIFQSKCYDAYGKEYPIQTWSTGYGDKADDDDDSYFLEKFPLKDYPYDEVWLCPSFSHYWKAKDEIIIVLE